MLIVSNIFAYNWVKQPKIPEDLECPINDVTKTYFEGVTKDKVDVDRQNCTFSLYDNSLNTFLGTFSYRIIQVYDCSIPTYPLMRSSCGLREVSFIGPPLNLIVSNVEFPKYIMERSSTVGAIECSRTEESLTEAPLTGSDINGLNSWAFSLITDDAELAWSVTYDKVLTEDNTTYYFKKIGTDFVQGENPNVPNRGLSFTGTIYNLTTGEHSQTFFGHCPNGVDYTQADYRAEFGNINKRNYNGVYSHYKDIPFRELLGY